jgi:hypothetical protein
MTGVISGNWPAVSAPERLADDDISGRMGTFKHGINVPGGAYGFHEI